MSTTPITAKLTEKQVVEALGRATVNESVSALLEATGLTAGTSVAVLDDPIYGMSGQRGTINGNTADKIGYVDVKFGNGNVVPLLSNMLIAI